ncbi:MAG: EutN/CcmL family microcompartment protein [Planctomycetes bacterium]|nr:EutN/CcmL family microcompartment protein [Planctomycetota bacterium]
MNFGTVIGTIWATRRHPSTEGLSLRLVRPEDAAGNVVAPPLVAVDTMGAGVGERVFYVTAREAVLALPDVDESPVDAAIVGIIEGVQLSDVEGGARS